MPNGIMAADTRFPHFSEGQSTEEKLYSMQSYLYMLLEELRYTLSNIGKGNFNEAAFTEISDEIAGPVKKTVESLDLAVTNGDGNSARIQITGEGLKAEAKDIIFSGMVTFQRLGDVEDTTVINGASIQTGTISAMNVYGSTFYCTLTEGKRREGDIFFRYKSKAGEEVLAGGLCIDDRGAGTGAESKNRVILYSEESFVLKLKSENNVSIEGRNIYISGGMITLTGLVNIDGTLMLNGEIITGGSTE